MNLNFSGHETFPLRQLWPYKASRLILDSKSPFSKDKDMSMMNMGLGANMLKSISFWILSSGLYKRDNEGSFSILPFGELILNEGNGDPYLEKIETLWLLHHQLCTNVRKNSSFFWIFNMNNDQIFSFEDFKRGVNIWHEKENIEKNKKPTEPTLKKDFNVTMGMYSSRNNKEDFEDSVQYPFWSLGLIKQAQGIKHNFQLIKRTTCDIPKVVFYYSLLDYICKSQKTEAVTFDNLLNDHFSPGRILQLTDYPLRMYLENLENDLSGKLIFDDTAGQRMVLINEKLDPIDYLKENLYK